MKPTITYHPYQPKTGQRCSCKRGQQRDNCPQCEGTGWIIDFRAIRALKPAPSTSHDPMNPSPAIHPAVQQLNSLVAYFDAVTEGRWDRLTGSALLRQAEVSIGRRTAARLNVAMLQVRQLRQIDAEAPGCPQDAPDAPTATLTPPTHQNAS